MLVTIARKKKKKHSFILNSFSLQANVFSLLEMESSFLYLKNNER